MSNIVFSSKHKCVYMRGPLLKLGVILSSSNYPSSEAGESISLDLIRCVSTAEDHAEPS